MRNAVLGLFILSLSGSLKASPAEALSAYRREDGGLTLTGENCDLLKRHLSALSYWKNLLKEPSLKSSNDCACDSFKCYMSIDAVVPKIVEKYHDVDAGRWGPNCWNTVLVSSQILPILRFTPPEEMSFWISSPLCKAIPQDEAPQPGDVVAIRDSAGNEVHAFIYVTEELAFSKNYLTTVAPYKLQATAAVFTEFPVTFSCRQRLGHPNDCLTYANYFRCSTLADYIQNKKIDLSPRYTEIEALIRDQEAIVSQIIFEWKTNLPLQKASPLKLKDVQITIHQVQAEVDAHSIQPKNTADQKLLWNGLKFRIDGLLKSIDWI